jgi:hypothetical protein
MRQSYRWLALLSVLLLVRDPFLASPLSGLPNSNTGLLACEWNLASDFRPFPADANPNPDACGDKSVWHFFGSPSLTRDPQTYYLLSYFATNTKNAVGLQAWEGPNGENTLPPNTTLPLVGMNVGNVADPNWLPGRVVVHTWQNTGLVIIGWRSPITGVVSITSTLRDADSGGGDGVSWFVDKNSADLASGGFNNGGSQSLSQGTGSSALASITVTIGDFLYLIVDPRTNDAQDTTEVDLSIQLADWPSGRWLMPDDYMTTGPATLHLTAEANAAPGSSIQQVEFSAFYDGAWHSAGIVSTPTGNPAMYSVDWQTPNTLRSQMLRFAIHVSDTLGRQTQNAGGSRRVVYRESVGNPAVVENWVPTRAYLNQLSLSPHGNWKCNVSSIAMVLAMEGYIALDYQSMASKANELYPLVAPNNAATIDTEWKGLHSVASDAYQLSHATGDAAWPQLKALIDAGHPGIIDSLPGRATTAGPFVVGVGYREENGQRFMITYDPFGQWLGTVDNYNKNSPGDSSSYVGMWVSYDFDRLTGNNVYLYAAHSAVSLSRPAVGIPTTAPDQISDEARVAGKFDGVPQGPWPQVFVPFVGR